MGVGFFAPLRDTFWRIEKNYALLKWSPNLHKKIKLMEQMMHLPKNKLKTLPLLIKLLCKNQVLHLKMQAKIKVKINLLLLKLKSLLKMIKANIPR